MVQVLVSSAYDGLEMSLVCYVCVCYESGLFM